MESNGGDTVVAAGFGVMFMLLCLVIGLGVYALMYWKVFAKAGRPGWASIVPIYNIIVLLQVAGRPIWWIIFFLIAAIPFVGLVTLVFWVIICLDVAKKFGKGVGFAVGMIIPCTAIIFWPILGFGDAKYQGAMPPPAPQA